MIMNLKLMMTALIHTLNLSNGPKPHLYIPTGAQHAGTPEDQPHLGMRMRKLA